MTGQLSGLKSVGVNIKISSNDSFVQLYFGSSNECMVFPEIIDANMKFNTNLASKSCCIVKFLLFSN